MNENFMSQLTTLLSREFVTCGNIQEMVARLDSWSIDTDTTLEGEAYDQHVRSLYTAWVQSVATSAAALALLRIQVDL